MNTQQSIAPAFLEDDLKQISKVAKIDLEELRDKYEKIISEPTNLHQIDCNISEPKMVNYSGFIRTPETSKCHEVPFQFSFFKILGVKFILDVCPGEHWQATLRGSFLVFGTEVTTREWKFDYNSAQVCEEISLTTVLGIRICFGARGHKTCFYVKGDVWSLFSRESFDETIFCLR